MFTIPYGKGQFFAPQPIALNTGHPLTQGLLFCAFPGLCTCDLVSGASPSTLGANIFPVTGTAPNYPVGYSINRSSGTGDLLFPNTINQFITGGTECTILYSTNTPTAVSAAPMVVVPYNNANTTPFVLMDLGRSANTTTGLFRWADNTGAAQSSTATSFLVANTWSLYGVTRSGTSVIFYRDGRQFSTATASGNAFGTPATVEAIGVMSNAPAALRPATSCGIVAIWNRALSASEIALIANNPTILLRQQSQIIIDLSNTVEGDCTASLVDPISSASGAHGVEGSASATLLDPSCTAEGSHSSSVTGEASSVLENPIASSAGSHGVSGSVSATLFNPSLSASGSYIEPASGTVTATLFTPVLSGSGSHVSYIGTVSASTYTSVAIASGSHTPFTGSVSASLFDPTLSSTGSRGVAGEINATLYTSLLTASGTHIPHTGEVSATTFNPSANSQGVHGVSGPIASSCFNPALTASGSHTPYLGSVSSTLSTPNLNSSGVHGVSGDSSANLFTPSCEAIGTYDEGSGGTANITLEDPSASISGLHSISGVASSSLYTTTLNGAGYHIPHVGEVTSTLFNPLATIASGHGVTGAISSSTQAPSCLASGTRGVTGGVTGSLFTPNLSSTGEHITLISGSAEVALPNPVLSGTGFQSVLGTASSSPPSPACLGTGSHIPYVGQVSSGLSNPIAQSEAIHSIQGEAIGLNGLVQAEVNGAHGVSGAVISELDELIAEASGQYASPTVYGFIEAELGNPFLASSGGMVVAGLVSSVLLEPLCAGRVIAIDISKPTPAQRILVARDRGRRLSPQERNTEVLTESRDRKLAPIGRDNKILIESRNRKIQWP